MQKLVTLIFPVAFLFSFSLVSMMSVDYQEEENLDSVLHKSENKMSSQNFYPQLLDYLSTLESEFDQIATNRKEELKSVSKYISKKKEKAESIDVIVICTHNSRRSHMGQLWLWAAAQYYGIEAFQSYSGGTESTAFYPSAVNAMREAGFKIQKMEEGANPKYEVSSSENGERLNLYSKKYSSEANPQEGFAALLVCSSADAACPIVSGAEERFAVPYRDPKEFDGTDKEAAAYVERCRQIAREMFYVMKQVENS